MTTRECNPGAERMRFSAQELLVRGRAAEPDAAEFEQGCYSMLTANRNGAVMVDFRKRTGDSIALPYSYLTEASFNASAGILLRFVGHDVRIAGRNLRALFDSLMWHKVTWIRETQEGSIADERPEVISIGIQERP